MKISLFHGRHSPDEEMDDWGFDGPVLTGVKWVHVTYGEHNVCFVDHASYQYAKILTGWDDGNDDNCLIMRMQDDMVHIVDGTAPAGFYGDWDFMEDSDNVRIPLPADNIFSETTHG